MEELGSGQFGMVYKGILDEANTPGYIVATKVVRPGVEDSGEL